MVNISHRTEIDSGAPFNNSHPKTPHPECEIPSPLYSMLRMQRQGAPDGNDCFQIAVAHTPPSATLSTGARGSWFTNGLALSDDCYLMAHRTLDFLKNWNFHVSPVTSPPSGCIRGISQKGGDDRTHAPHDAARKVVHGACGRRCGSDGGAAGLKRDKRKHGPPLHAQCKYNTAMNAGN